MCIAVEACGIGAQRTLYFKDFKEDFVDWEVWASGTLQLGTSFSPLYAPEEGVAQVGNGGNAPPRYPWTAVTGGAFTRFRPAGSAPLWRNLSTEAPNGVVTQIGIYLDTSASNGLTNDKGLEWSVALYDNSTPFVSVQDFMFNIGFYNDGTAPGIANTNRFVAVASNNAGTDPIDHGRQPQVIATTSGWYNFQHRFYTNGTYVFCELSVWTQNCGQRIATWTRGPALIEGKAANPLPLNRAAVLRNGWFTRVESPNNVTFAHVVHNIVL